MQQTDITYSCRAPEQLTEEQLDQACRLVIAGGGVNADWIRHNLTRAFLIARAEFNGRLVGISSLKRPREEYVQRIHDKLGIDIRGFLERGYTSVLPECRGLGVGSTLLAELTSRADGHHIYSLIREENHAAQQITMRNQAVKILTFHSELAGKEVGFWMLSRTAAQLGLTPIAAARGDTTQS